MISTIQFMHLISVHFWTYLPGNPAFSFVYSKSPLRRKFVTLRSTFAPSLTNSTAKLRVSGSAFGDYFRTVAVVMPTVRLCICVMLCFYIY